ncbi:hypothetical protein ISG33_00915 [Glaciecola sp. MH2013]|uniref:hypothetical protein n=1 Tax=Glaciecola sp. MH2013 TaxID=2785524 RepID=UPI00189DFB39|nr:hypothetical protein [Glaciecola sp. MH2013]MBF7071959.1 hypothetical protein [Glaciecola sp. MH2013]
MKVQRYVRSLHKWLGLVLVIQLFFWIAGGLIMSAIPLENVHGKHLAVKELPNPFSFHDYSFDLQTVLNDLNAGSKASNRFTSTQRVEFTEYQGTPAYLITSATGQELRSAIDGLAFPTLRAEQVRSLAKQHYIYTGNPSKKIASTTLLEIAPQEVATQSDRLWRVNFDDTWNTSLYFSDSSAQLVSIRSDIWRLFDFVWMLHIMDYDEREDFNNPLLIAFAACSVLFTITGMLMLMRSLRYRPKQKI